MNPIKQGLHIVARAYGRKGIRSPGILPGFEQPGRLSRLCQCLKILRGYTVLFFLVLRSPVIGKFGIKKI